MGAFFFRTDNFPILSMIRHNNFRLVSIRIVCYLRLQECSVTAMALLVDPLFARVVVASSQVSACHSLSCHILGSIIPGNYRLDDLQALVRADVSQCEDNTYGTRFQIFNGFIKRKCGIDSGNTVDWKLSCPV